MGIFRGVSYVGQMLELLSDHGLPWVSVEYRLGADRSETKGVEDVATAVAFVREQAETFDIDPERLLLLGEDTGADRRRPAAPTAAGSGRSGLHRC